MVGLTSYHFGERFFLSQIRFDLLGISVIVREGCVNLSEAEVRMGYRTAMREHAGRSIG